MPNACHTSKIEFMKTNFKCPKPICSKNENCIKMHIKRKYLSMITLLMGFVLICSCKKDHNIKAPALINSGSSATAQILDTIINTGTFKLHFRIAKGKGVPIVFEAGAGDDGSVWKSLIDPLHNSTGAPLITYDRVGFGKSPLDTIGLNINNEINSLGIALNKLGYSENYFLVGHSFGGAYTITFADKNQGKVKGGVMIDITAPNFMTEEFTNALVNSFGSKLDEAKISNPGQYYQWINYKASITQLRASASSLIIPLTVICAEQSPLTGDDNLAWRAGQKAFAAQRPNRKFVLAVNTTHYIFWDNPKLVIDQITTQYKADCL